MSKQKKAENYFFNLALLIAAFLITSVYIATGLYTQDGYNLKAGDVSDRRFKATRKVENTIATERNRKEAEKEAMEMKPLRIKDSEISERVIRNVSDLFVKLESIRSVYMMEQAEQAAREAAQAEREAAQAAEAERKAKNTPEPEQDNADIPEAAQPAVSAAPAQVRMQPGIHHNTRDITTVSVLKPANANPADSNDPMMPLTAMEQLDQLQLTLSDSQSRLLLNMDDEHYEKLKHAIRQSLENVLEQGVQEVDAKSLLDIQNELVEFNITSEMRNIAYQIASSFLESNFIIDEAATEAARQEIANRYTVAYRLQGETIVDEGQVIDDQAYAMLESLGLISNGLRDTLIPIIASVILVAILFILVFVYMRMFCQKLAARKKEAALLFSIYTVIITAIRLLVNVPYQFLPILIFTMLVAMLIDLRLSIVLNIFITISAMLIYQGKIEFFIFFAIAGLAVSLLSKYTTERNQVFIVGVVACPLSFILMFLISLFFQRTYSVYMVIEAGYAAGNGIFTVIVCLGSLPFWEAFFEVTSNIKLLDLTNPSNALLRRLINEAPGTYHHSLVVANLAETAAYEIGADANLARVGGYYHDIGKMKNPHFFAENQGLLSESPHKGLTPLASSNIIIDHVRYGIELAEEHKLPQAVKEFIIQHHGNTLIQYFYCKAKEECIDGEQVKKSDYKYPFVIPQSKETAILMIADTLEAAIRSIKKGFKDFNEIETDIKRLIRAKLDEGQLLDSGLSIKDLDLITIAFLRVFKGMYHERIEYPKIETHEITSADGEVSTA